jgi:thiosulfate/3-mercaptopyruvate sulfurtransferase
VSLISADQLARRMARGEPTRIAVVRWYLNRPGAGRTRYLEGHLPGAVFLDLDVDLSAPDGLGAPGRHPLPRPTDFARRLADEGIGSEDFVVAYDDTGGTTAARLWWMLDNLGHRGGVAVLDGGIGAWTGARKPLTSRLPEWPAAELELADEWRGVIERDELARRLGRVALIDARADERYRGEVEPVDPVAGHIPTAVSLPTGANVGPDGRMLGQWALRDRYAPLAEAGEAIVYCGSGTTACHSILAMKAAGLPEPSLYVGSFSDWSRSGLPVATGSEPGDAPQLDSPP